MIVEFTGVPGAGKTTLLPAVKVIIDEHGFIALSRWEAEQRCARRSPVGRAVGRLGAARGGIRLRAVLYPALVLSALGFTFKNFRLVGHVVISQWSHPTSRRGWLKRLRRFFGMAARYELFHKHLAPREVVVLDEGLAHQAVNLYVSEVMPPDAAALGRYLSLLPPPDLVIEIRARLAGCMRRMSVRGLPNRLRGKSKQEVERFLSHAENVLQAVSRKLAERGERWAAVDNVGALEQCRAGLRRGLEEILQASIGLHFWLASLLLDNGAPLEFWKRFFLS